MKRCRCCRQSWPIECFRVLHGTERRERCKACESGCRWDTRTARERRYRRHLREQVAAVRKARAA